MDAFGKVLLESYKTNSSILYCVERHDQFIAVSDSSIYFSDYNNFSDLEKNALKHVNGDVLELGSGAGRMCLYLQENGYDVIASDMSDGAIEVCKARGVNQVQKIDMTQLDLENTFDTILIFGNTIPIVGNQIGLTKFMDECHNLLSPGGKLIGNFLDPSNTDDPFHLAFHQSNRENNKPIGTMSIRIRYRQYIGDWFDFWLPELHEFKACVNESKWDLTMDGDVFYTFIMEKL